MLGLGGFWVWDDYTELQEGLEELQTRYMSEYRHLLEDKTSNVITYFGSSSRHAVSRILGISIKKYNTPMNGFVNILLVAVLGYAFFLLFLYFYQSRLLFLSNISSRAVERLPSAAGLAFIKY